MSGYVRKYEPPTHVCGAPGGDYIPHRGDLWRCTCGRLWRLGAACAICDRYGDQPHQGMHDVGMAWHPASLWERWRHRKVQP